MPAARSRLPVAAVLIAATALLPSTGCIVAGTTLAIIAVGSIIRDAEVRALRPLRDPLPGGSPPDLERVSRYKTKTLLRLYSR